MQFLGYTGLTAAIIGTMSLYFTLEVEFNAFAIIGGAIGLAFGAMLIGFAAFTFWILARNVTSIEYGNYNPFDVGKCNNLR